MNEKKYDHYDISIDQPGFMLVINNKLTRTPFKIRIPSKQLSYVKSIIKMNSISEYQISGVDKEVEKKKINKIKKNKSINVDFSNHETIIEELYENPKEE